MACTTQYAFFFEQLACVMSCINVCTSIFCAPQTNPMHYNPLAIQQIAIQQRGSIAGEQQVHNVNGY
jgi:hypothetical protein